jgi:phosphotransferase system enzyme I (PtsI)
MSDPHTDFETEETRRAERRVEGIGVAPGIAIGTVHRYQLDTPEIHRREISPDEVEDELSLLADALDRAEQELARIRAVAQDRIGEEGEALLDAQEMMLRDDEVLDPIRERIREKGESAAQALSTVLRAHRRRLEASDDEYLRERAGELEEFESRLLQSLQRGKAAATIQPSSIVVADRLTAADVIRFQRHGMLGCVTCRGGETSHVSIIARALNLPAVVGAEGVLESVADHDRIIVDGRRGRVIVHPTADTLDRYRKRRAHQQARLDEQDRTALTPARSADGRRVALRANVDFAGTLDSLDRYGAEGIGLMRTELLFLSGVEESLSEDRQRAVYRHAAEASGEHGATVRLLDLGGDKMLPFAQQEQNPFLGWRGIRVLLDRTDDLLRPQVRALLRANRHGTLRMLLPMVAHLDEVHRVRSVVEEEAERLDAQDVPHDADLPIGVMVEVPVVALQARRFAEAVDFLSIGTNDLTQYVLAVDRGNDRVADRYDALHPAVLGLIRRTVEAGRTTDTPVVLCGEVAGDVHALPILLGLGLDGVSVSPPYLPTVRHVVANTTIADTQALVERVLETPDAGTVRHHARVWCDEQYDSEVFTSPDPS